MAKIVVPVVKSKGTVELDTDTLPQEVYEEALKLGLKELANRGMSKITKTTYPKADELKAAAQAKAEANVAAMNEGKIRFMTGKTKGASGAVMTEARRLAKNIVKDELKKAKIKISHVDPKEITAAAKALLESETGPSIIEQATANLAEREKTSIKGIDISALVKTSPELVAKAEAKRKDKPLSAKQAGKVAKRKPGTQPTA